MPGKVFGVILAAGQSRRFGPRDKLAARRPGQGAIVLRPARALAGLGLARRMAVTRSPYLPRELRGAGVALLPLGGRPSQAASLRHAIRAAQKGGASHLLILLGDTPGLSRADLKPFLTRPGTHPAMALHAGRLGPPALIPRRLFGRLLRLHGDRGAGAILRRCPDLRRHRLEAGVLHDIDRPEDLAGISG